MIDPLCEADLKEGRNADTEEALKHPKKHPERIIYAICKLVVMGEGRKAYSSREIEEEAFGDLVEKQERKANPVDQISSVLSGNKPANSSEGVFQRWSSILDKRVVEGRDYQYYTVKESKYEEIKEIFDSLT